MNWDIYVQEFLQHTGNESLIQFVHQQWIDMMPKRPILTRGKCGTRIEAAFLYFSHNFSTQMNVS